MTVRRLITIFGLSIATAAAAQQTATPPPATATTSTQVPRVTEPVTADTDKDINDTRALRLSMDEAIQLSIRQNLGVELQRFSTMEQGQDLIAQYGLFDPLATANLSRRSSESATSSKTQSGSSSGTTANVGLSQNLPTGGSYLMTFTNSRTNSSTRYVQTIGGVPTQVSDTTLAIPTGLGLSVSQPLARNFGIDITRRNINLARNTLGISREQFRGVLLATTNAVEQAYYDLVYARQYIDVVKEAVFLARDQARITQIRIDVGASAPLDILQPRVQITTTEEQLIVAIASVRSAEDRLRQLMNLPPDQWDRPIVPTDKVAYAPVPVDLEQAVAKAYTLRPEIKENQWATASSRIQYLYARNQLLPQFDAVGGYNLAGTAGRTTGDPTSSGYSQSIQQLLRTDFPGWNVGVNIGIPVFNVAAKAEAKRAQLDLARLQTTEAQTRQNIAVDVRTAARAIDTAAKEITATRAARDAAEQNLAAEQKRYENGMTTNFQVLQVQQQLSDARARELNALVSYNKAVTAYHLAVGDLLDVTNITVDEPTVQEPRIFSSWDRYNWLKFENHVRAED